ncbi:MAG: NTP transferase domain-containing protein [Methanomicrobium sp.]|nr:NTP transferase domain-containing protein [Methanomicrobium sp.]
MECVILAAGEGKRMRPLTASRPKVMLPVAGKPMLEHLIVSARDAGIKDFILVVGYKEQDIRDYFKDGGRFGVKVRYAVQRKQSGTANALLCTENLVKGPFMLLNGDMILNTRDILSFANQHVPCVGTVESTHPQDFGVLETEGHKVISIVEKPKEPKSNLVNAGIYLFDTGIFAILRGLSLSERGEYELPDALMEYASKGLLHHYTLSSWFDIGEPWNLLDANEKMTEAIFAQTDDGPSPDSADFIKGTIEDGVYIHGNVILGEGSVIKSGTYIEGDCIIGKDCDIGPHAYIRGCTSVGDNCHIGHSVEIKNSIVMNGTKIPHFNYVGDSVIGSGCNFGAGTKIANLRHDRRDIRCDGRDTKRRKFGAVIGDDVQFGINCSVNAGSSVGSRVKAAPNSYISGKINDDTVLGR